MNISNAMVGHIQNVKSPKEAQDNLINVFVVNRKTRRLQLKNELHTIKKVRMADGDYTLTIKSICELQASINVEVNDEARVEVFFCGLWPSSRQS